MSTPRPVYPSVRGHHDPPNSSGARLSSRQLYPTFLSLHETVLLQLSWAWKGLLDAFRWNAVFLTIASDAEIRGNVYKSLLLNSVSLLSIHVFDLFLHPMVRDQPKWVHRNIGWFYQILWLCPVVGTSLYLNGVWCTTIAKRTFLLQHGGRPVASQPVSYVGMLTALASSAYRVVMASTSVVLSYLVSKIPVVGPVASFVLYCWVDAYYCFEFVWISRGLSLSRRIRYLEERWAYFLAFGLTPTALCVWGTPISNAAMFALVFPMYIIMAITARPVPQDPYNPVAAPSQANKPQEAETIRHPSPFIPIRLPIFAIVIVINDAVVRVLNLIGGRPPVKHKAAGFSWNRREKDDGESVEEGGGGRGAIKRETFNTGTGAGGSVPTSASRNPWPAPRPASARVNIGVRRKVD